MYSADLQRVRRTTKSFSPVLLHDKFKKTKVKKNNGSPAPVYKGLKAIECLPIVPNNPLCDELYKVLGDPFDEAKWNQLKENTSLFKLTWKQEYPMMKDGEKTFYGMLIESRLLQVTLIILIKHLKFE